jgi:antitoxin ParD1/3/4
MFRKTIAVLSLSAASLTSFAVSAHAADAAPAKIGEKTSVLKCVGSAERKQAQALRAQALQAESAALNARLTVAQAANKTAAVAKIQAHIAKVNTRIATVQANTAKLATKCP